MSTTVQSGTTLMFDRFWRWLLQHRNCLVRAGGADSCLYDQEDFHWQLEEDPDRNAVIQLCRGKVPVAELVVDAREVLFVQSMPEEGDRGAFIFELVGGPQG